MYCLYVDVYAYRQGDKSYAHFRNLVEAWLLQHHRNDHHYVTNTLYQIMHVLGHAAWDLTRDGYYDGDVLVFANLLAHHRLSWPGILEAAVAHLEKFVGSPKSAELLTLMQKIVKATLAALEVTETLHEVIRDLDKAPVTDATIVAGYFANAAVNATRGITHALAAIADDYDMDTDITQAKRYLARAKSHLNPLF